MYQIDNFLVNLLYLYLIEYKKKYSGVKKQLINFFYIYFGEKGIRTLGTITRTFH